jgi:putative polyketide hydroxylase
MTRSDRTPEVPVVIAGAGPAGLVAAITLARNGIGSLLVERNPGLSPLPRATGVSVRTMELLRSWGLEDEVRAGQLDLAHARGFATGSLASPEGTAVPAGFPDFEEAAAASPTTAAAVPQDHLEPVLLGHLRGLAGAEVRFGTELAAFDQDGGGVTVTLREHAGGAEEFVRAGWLVGADGAHSPVRTGLGIAMDGPGHLAEQLTVLFEAPLATVVGDRRYGIYFVQHPRAGGVFVPNGPRDRWLYGRTWDPEHERLEDYTDARLSGLIRTAAGVGDLPVRVVAMGAFSFAAQVAERYREGCAFLVGDAAQRMTPRSGMGMNTAVAEAHDLGWKLAWVLNGWAGPGLLDTYEAEWRPVGARRAARSTLEGWEPPGPEAVPGRLLPARSRRVHLWIASVGSTAPRAPARRLAAASPTASAASEVQGCAAAHLWAGSPADSSPTAAKPNAPSNSLNSSAASTPPPTSWAPLGHRSAKPSPATDSACPPATPKQSASGPSPPPASAPGSPPRRPWTRCSWRSTPTPSPPGSGHRPSCTNGSAARSSTPPWAPTWWSS